ncbi:MAG: acyl-CoA dehydrogenase family protein [Pseudomonadales bacterium]|nr:acyl-CoA dehydrogenase family protein [Pseudomonadales bacterium]
MAPSQKELDEFKLEAESWFDTNTPAQPSFALPDSFMEVGTDEQFNFLRDWQNKVYEAGYLGIAWPKELGGRGMDPAFQNITDAVMAKRKVPFMMNTIGLCWAGPMIMQMGSEEQKQKYIKRILSAEDIWCQGFSEPDNGSDLGNAQLKAVKDGDDYVLNGAKIWTSLGSHADHMILLARTNPEATNKYAGLSFFLSPMKIDGVKPVPLRKITGEYGFTETFFTDARIPASCMVGAEGMGWQVAMATLAFERGASTGQAGGQSMVMLEASQVVDLARRAKRDGKPAIEDPIVRDKIVQFLITERALLLNEKRRSVGALNAERPFAIPLASKLQYSEFRRELCQFAVSLQGSEATLYYGDEQAIDSGFWQRAYFNAFSATIGGGTSEIQRNILGERVLGLPKG